VNIIYTVLDLDHWDWSAGIRRAAPRSMAADLRRPHGEFETQFYERILAGRPDNPEAIEQLGHLYTSSKRYEDGLAMDRRLVGLRPRDALAHYNLACSYSLTRQVEESLEALARAIRLGYRDYAHMEKDPDLSSARSHPGWKKLMDLKPA